MTTNLIYIHDPLCGWCFGFLDAMDHLRATLPDLPIELRLGGLVIGERVAPYHSLSDYIKASAPQMQARTGARIGKIFFDKMLPSDTLMSSQPPNAALLTVREAAPNKAVDYAHAVQRAHFHDGADLNAPELYPALAKELGLNGIKFDIPGAHDLPEALAQEYRSTRALNFSGFPSLFLQTNKAAPLPLELHYKGPELVNAVTTALPIASQN